MLYLCDGVSEHGIDVISRYLFNDVIAREVCSFMALFDTEDDEEDDGFRYVEGSDEDDEGAAGDDEVIDYFDDETIGPILSLP